jgi:hypothetical protein
MQELGIRHGRRRGDRVVRAKARALGGTSLASLSPRDRRGHTKEVQWLTCCAPDSSREPRGDSQAQVGRVPPLLAKDRSEEGQAPEPRHVQEPRCRGEARARGSVLQAQLSPACGTGELAGTRFNGRAPGRYRASRTRAPRAWCVESSKAIRRCGQGRCPGLGFPSRRWLVASTRGRWAG